MSDPLAQIADRHIVIASAAIEAELRDGKGPLIAIWRDWRKNAADSLAALVTLNVHVPAERMAILTHQNEVKRYVEYTNALVKAYHEGIAIDQAMTDQERRDLIELVRALPEEERAMIDIGDERDVLDQTID